MSAGRAVITGLGVVSPIGTGLRDFWSALREGRARFCPHEGASGARRAGLVSAEPPAARRPDGRAGNPMDKLSALMCLAASASLEDAGLEPSALDPEQAGTVVGTGLSTISTNARFMRSAFEDHPRFVSPVDFANATPNTPAAQVGIHLGLSGPNATVSTGQSSGLRALAYARDMLAQGHADVMLVGGCEEVTSFALERLAAAGALAEDLPRPFDRRRSGTLAAEGAACLVLETEEHARCRGARVYAEVLAHAYERAPRAGADEAVAAGAATLERTMGEALELAQVPLREVDYVSANANGCRLTDAVELRALEAISERAAATLRVGSVKSTLGETYGAAAVFQALAACLSMDEGELPPEPRLEEPDTASPRLKFHRGPHSSPIRACLVNAFDARGSYASMVLAAPLPGGPRP